MSKHSAQTLTAPVLRIEMVNPLERLVTTVVAWQQRYEMRRHLLEMEDRLLDDIGMSRAQARLEADKPFWRA